MRRIKKKSEWERYKISSSSMQKVEIPKRDEMELKRKSMLQVSESITVFQSLHKRNNNWGIKTFFSFNGASWFLCKNILREHIQQNAVISNAQKFVPATSTLSFPNPKPIKTYSVTWGILNWILLNFKTFSWIKWW